MGPSSGWPQESPGWWRAVVGRSLPAWKPWRKFVSEGGAASCCLPAVRLLRSSQSQRHIDESLHSGHQNLATILIFNQNSLLKADWMMWLLSLISRYMTVVIEQRFSTCGLWPLWQAPTSKNMYIMVHSSSKNDSYEVATKLILWLAVTTAWRTVLNDRSIRKVGDLCSGLMARDVFSSELVYGWSSTFFSGRDL